MMQGSIMNGFMARKMKYKGDLELSGNKTHFVVPVAFTQGKAKLKKDEQFDFITATKVQFLENLVTVEWNPELERQSNGHFIGTPLVGPSDDLRALRGTLVAAREFDISKLGWLCKLWVHDR
jgi:hypothetical protein